MQGTPQSPRSATGDPMLPTGSGAEAHWIAALQRGDEQAFASLIATHHLAMVHTALLYVSSVAIAEDVVQETWLEVLRGLARFEGRASLKTWIFRILTNIAKTRGRQESRSVTFSALIGPDDEADEPAVPPERFYDSGPWRGGWRDAPQTWANLPEERLLAGETRARITEAIKMLAPQQRAVITLRDVSGWTSDEVCAVLDISPANQRVLLHRARAKVRGTLEVYFAAEQAPAMP